MRIAGVLIAPPAPLRTVHPIPTARWPAHNDGAPPSRRVRPTAGARTSRPSRAARRRATHRGRLPAPARRPGRRASSRAGRWGNQRPRKASPATWLPGGRWESPPPANSTRRLARAPARPTAFPCGPAG
ncbi:hypothetical protein G6F45_013816 [Rhizopus arrhizus]|nr:hypothetical protein G6F45_013816 [Rhizopus arrhizus]